MNLESHIRLLYIVNMIWYHFLLKWEHNTLQYHFEVFNPNQHWKLCFCYFIRVPNWINEHEYLVGQPQHSADFLYLVLLLRIIRKGRDLRCSDKSAVFEHKNTFIVTSMSLPIFKVKIPDKNERYGISKHLLVHLVGIQYFHQISWFEIYYFQRFWQS